MFFSGDTDAESMTAMLMLHAEFTAGEWNDSCQLHPDVTTVNTDRFQACVTDCERLPFLNNRFKFIN